MSAPPKSRGTSFVPGSVWWIDVSSTDPARSRDFYAELFGWSYQIDPGPGRGHYTTALLNGRPVAGLAGVPALARRPVAWTLYLASANIEYTGEVVTQWGGRVLAGPVDVPGRGRMLIGMDPTGAVIGFCQPRSPGTLHTTGPGSLSWAELNTWDGPRADKFFATVFGYRQQQIGDGIEVDYTIWSRGGRTMLCRLQMNQDWAAPDIGAHWLLYFAVDPRTGTDAAVDQVLALGGRVDFDPYDSELGRIARVADPFGAAFALVDPTQRLEPATDLAAGSARVDDPYDD
ncbi:MAG: VOC family protein [Pseudonocardiales bacterium]|nr:VOC family protein [Pseudonocardiales bacterium]MBV9730868.1 VOC family protein [Pseudonocardiales bacterium]